MPHKRSQEAILKRAEDNRMWHMQRTSYTSFVFDKSKRDYIISETVNRVSYEAGVEYLNKIYPFVLPGVVNKLELGEVLVDSRGNGTYQKSKR